MKTGKEDRVILRLDLDRVTGAMHYSKYHLHRMFSRTVGITVRDYILRRRLTEAARLLVFTRKSVLEIPHRLLGHPSAVSEK